MQLTQLVERLQRQLPNANDRRVACLAMLLCDRDPQLKCLNDGELFLSLLEEIQLRLNSIDDQHAAVAQELDQLASTEPCEFEPKHVWTLIRAIKVQSQFVDILTGSRSEQLSGSNSVND